VLVHPGHDMASKTFTLGRTLTRAALRRTALPLGLGLGTGLVAVHHQRPMRLDSAWTEPFQSSRSLATGGHDPKRKELLDADTVKQLSGAVSLVCCWTLSKRRHKSVWFKLLMNGSMGMQASSPACWSASSPRHSSCWRASPWWSSRYVRVPDLAQSQFCCLVLVLFLSLYLKALSRRSILA
jgi:hypothetical protein